MFEIEAAVGVWRNEVAREKVLTRDHLDELEDHLRSTWVALVETGFEPADAFDHARHAIGLPAELALEYTKTESVAWRRVLRLGWAMFAAAWLLPVHEYGITLFDNDLGGGLIPGFEAFWLAITGEAGAFGVISALTNFLMLATLWKISERGGKALTALGIVLLAATGLNGWWMVDVGAITELRPGYFAWWASFPVVATGVAMRARQFAKRLTAGDGAADPSGSGELAGV